MKNNNCKAMYAFGDIQSDTYNTLSVDTGENEEEEN